MRVVSGFATAAAEFARPSRSSLGLPRRAPVDMLVILLLALDRTNFGLQVLGACRCAWRDQRDELDEDGRRERWSEPLKLWQWRQRLSSGTHARRVRAPSHHRLAARVARPGRLLLHNRTAFVEPAVGGAGIF